MEDRLNEANLQSEFAHVLVPLAQAWQPQTAFFVYRIPLEMRPNVCPGCVVMIPFGTNITRGIVWRITQELLVNVESGSIYDIRAVLDPQPLLDDVRRRLAEWLSDMYATSLGLAVRVIVPGMTSAVLPMELIADPVAIEQRLATETDPQLRSMLALLRESGNVQEDVIRRALGQRYGGQIITNLEDAGIVARQQRIVTHRRKQDRLLAMTGDAEAVADWRAQAMNVLIGESPPATKKRSRAKTKPVGRGRGAFLQSIARSGNPRISPLSVFAALPVREAIRLRAAIAIIDFLQTRPDFYHIRSETMRIARATQPSLDILMQAHLIEERDLPAKNGTQKQQDEHADMPHQLRSEQQMALDHILDAMDAAHDLALLPVSDVPPVDLTELARPVLIHGITGSGKTEIYLQALSSAIASGRRGIVLVPEISLTPQTVQRFSRRFPGRVAVLHSALKPAERETEWLRIRASEVDVVIGSRSAIFAPLPDLGIIVLDEEHDHSYKHDQRPPTYHAREVAVALGRIAGAVVVLGSATPSVESFFKAQQGDYALFTLQERAATDHSSLPPVTVIDLREELHAGHTSILSRQLLTDMERTLARHEQVLLFLNRRGAASCVLCRDCGYAARCVRCDVPLTHHLRQQILLCHHCGWTEPQPDHCPQCGSTEIRFFGVGTERVEETVRRVFPQARVMRWDADTAKSLADHTRFTRMLAQRQVDIVIGTQMIAKGIDVPSVTLVGIIAADIALFLPDFRASERAFQTLTQVAGRAGRGDAAGKVILQTFSPTHFCIEAAAQHEYAAFYNVEIAGRRTFLFPPFRRFIKMTFTHRDRHTCQVEALTVGDLLSRIIIDHGLTGTDLVGPAPSFIEKLKGQYRWQIILRGLDPRQVINALQPGDLARGWMIDIDPMSAL